MPFSQHKKRSQAVGTACLACCAVFLGDCLVSANACAEDLKIETSISESGVWDSNPLGRKTDVKELYGETTTPQISIEKETPTTTLSLTTWIENNIFNQHDFDTTDFHGKVDLAKKTERLALGLGASGNYDTTRTSELTNFGTATAVVRHMGYSVKPSVKYSLSPISAVSLAGDYSKSSYDARSYVDYHTVSASPAYQRKLTEQYTGLVAMNARRYETDSGVDRVVDSVGPSVGIMAEFSKTWSGDFYVGQEATQDTRAGVVIRDWTWSSTYSADLSYKGDQDMIHFSLSRAQQPYGNGSESLLTSVGIEGEKKINQHFSLNGGGNYQFSDGDQTDGNQLDKQFSGKAGLFYHLTETLGVTSSYIYKHESFTNDDGVVKQNIVRLGLTYRPQFEAFW